MEVRVPIRWLQDQEITLYYLGEKKDRLKFSEGFFSSLLASNMEEVNHEPRSVGSP